LPPSDESVLELPPIRRLLATTPLWLLTACATGSASQAELAALRGEVRAMRESQARLAQRLEQLERQAHVSQARQAAPPAPEPGPAVESLVSVPALTVVRLKPRADGARPLATAVAVVEPPDSLLEQAEAPAALAPPEVPDASARADGDALVQAAFEQAMGALRTGNVEGGVARLTRLAQDNPRHPVADNALYFAGLGLVGLGEQERAAVTFETLIATYPDGDAVLEAMLRLAECRVRLGRRADARALYTRILTQYPGTAAATQAEGRLAALSQ
jgi:TolA-binding protein